MTPWTVAHQAPPSVGFSRQEYWSGVPLPSPMDPLWPLPFSTATWLPQEMPPPNKYWMLGKQIKVGMLVFRAGPGSATDGKLYDTAPAPRVVSRDEEEMQNEKARAFKKFTSQQFY